MNESNETPGSAAEKFAQYGVADSDLARVIVEFAEPMLKHCASYAAREEAISYAILAWNLSLESESGREESLHEMLAQLPAEKEPEIAALMQFLLRRKAELFADNRFLVVDYTLERRGEKMQIEMTTKYIPR